MSDGDKIITIICSTRPGRVGPAVARWFDAFANEQGALQSTLVDLAEVALPMYDEPAHPRKQDYRHEHTQNWSRIVAAADAFVFVLPEYNFSPPPSFYNAINYLFVEWTYKPCGFVCYGGVSGGLRSVQQARLMATSVRMMPLPEVVTVQSVAQHVSDGVFTPTEHHENSATGMLTELARWSRALATLRAGSA